jgi:uncharacterized membrane protein
MSDAICNWLLAHHVHPLVVVAILSALPVSELRGGIPAGVLVMKLPVWQTVPLAVVTNVAIVVPVLLWAEPVANRLRRFRVLDRFFTWLFDRARRKSVIVRKYGILGLTLFVAIPLPMTGAWTGALIAVILGINFWKSLLCVTLGVVIAATVVTLVCTGALEALRFLVPQPP